MFENMSKRERLLSTIVAFLVPVLLLFMVFMWFTGKYNDNSLRKMGLQSDLKKAKDVYDEAQTAKQRRIYYRENSLPPKLSSANAAFDEWVNGVVDRLGMKKTGLTRRELKTIKTVGRTPRVVGKIQSATLRMNGTLDQMVDFLHLFYNSGLIKRITSLQITPRTVKSNGPNKSVRSGRFSFSVNMEFVSLVDAEPDKEISSTTVALDHTLEEYKQRISARNIYAPANNPPVFNVKSKSVYAGDDIAFAIDADDADEQDQLDFELITSALEGATITSEDGSRRGSFKCPPLEIGEYTVGIRVFDNGNPSKDYTQDVVLVVSKKPNNQPTLAESRFEVYAGDEINLELIAKDKDEDSVKIEMFINEQLTDATLTQVDGENKAVVVSPPIEEVGEYRFDVKLDDGGEPKMRRGEPVENLVNVRINVLPPKFLMAAQTKITAIVRLKGVDRAWIHVRPTGEQHDVVVGDSFEVDRKTWVVKAISVADRKIVLEVENTTKTYKFGEFLSNPLEAKQVPQANNPSQPATAVKGAAKSTSQAKMSRLKAKPITASGNQ